MSLCLLEPPNSPSLFSDETVGYTPMNTLLWKSSLKSSRYVKKSQAPTILWLCNSGILGQYALPSGGREEKGNDPPGNLYKPEQVSVLPLVSCVPCLVRRTQPQSGSLTALHGLAFHF